MKKAIIFIFFICISFNLFADVVYIDDLKYLDKDNKQRSFNLIYITDFSTYTFSTINYSDSFYSFDFTLDYADALRKGIEKYETWKVIAKENSVSVRKEIPNSSYSVNVYWRSPSKIIRFYDTSVCLEAHIKPESATLSLVIKGKLYNSIFLDDLYFTFPNEDEVQRFYNALSPDTLNSKIIKEYENKQKMQAIDDLFQ